MAFTRDGRYLIAASVPEENCLVIFNAQTGMAIEGATVNLSQEVSINKIVVNPHAESSEVIEFITVGQRGCF